MDDVHKRDDLDDDEVDDWTQRPVTLPDGTTGIGVFDEHDVLRDVLVPSDPLPAPDRDDYEQGTPPEVKATGMRQETSRLRAAPHPTAASRQRVRDLERRAAELDREVMGQLGLQVRARTPRTPRSAAADRERGGDSGDSSGSSEGSTDPDLARLVRAALSARNGQGGAVAAAFARALARAEERAPCSGDPPPRLVVEIPLEGIGRISLDAGCREDELRLRAWLRSSGQLPALVKILGRILDDLDHVDETGEWDGTLG